LMQAQKLHLTSEQLDTDIDPPLRGVDQNLRFRKEKP
jgi:hypothetical protein